MRQGHPTDVQVAHLIVLQNAQLDLLRLMLLLFGLGVGLLLALLGTTSKTSQHMHSGFVTNATFLQALSSLEIVPRAHKALTLGRPSCT